MPVLDNVCETLILNNGEKGVLRNFNDDDLEHVVAVELDASASPWSRKNFIDSITSSHICVGISYQENWLAHAVFSVAAGEAELLIITVNRDYRRQGIASQLLECMEEKLSKYANEIFLEVRASNRGAINLYEALGFNCIGERRNYYPALSDHNKEEKVPPLTKHTNAKREDALIYGKHLVADFS